MEQNYLTDQNVEIASEINRSYQIIADGTPGFVKQEASLLLNKLEQLKASDSEKNAFYFQREALSEALNNLNNTTGRAQGEWADTVKYILAQMSAYWDKRTVSIKAVYAHKIGSVVIHKATGRQAKVIGAKRSAAHNGRAIYTVRFIDGTDEMKTCYARELTQK